MRNRDDKLNRILNLSLEISEIKDIDLLLEKVLGEARAFTACDAGSIYVREGDHLRFSYAQNDTLRKQLPPGRKLPYATFTVPISNTSIAGYVATNGTILNIPDVYELAPAFPFSFNRSYDAMTGYRTRSMLTIPLKNIRGDIIGVLQLINAVDASGTVVPFPPDEEGIILYFANNAASAIERAKMTREIIMRMNKMAEMRDPKETGPHVNRVAAYAVTLYEAWAQKKGIPQEEIDKNRDVLRMAAMLHDVGKVAISDTILKKPGRFTPEEFQEMKLHTQHGANLFADIYSDFDESAAIVALNHHERWDGNGYPGHVDPITRQALPGFETENGGARGKKGEEIPLFGRIVALVDVYDALSCRRCYKEAWDEESVLGELRAGSGKQFDPELVEVFMECIDTIRQVEKLYPDEEAG
ncbi:HD domain-containing phosphohydrolase [Geobacter sp. SVR]|uniref:HD domain-containing phosphohydrolase n=1 Tax=Geobacter sp. SVR TaxID=2495594 RepID=UPI00143EF7A2|nr:HD domain-containing phosphohydrolase [Geobacter sp. SVR]BCS54611.1 phosphohydrolase [Geobacter sp. SVR]GCF86882.1 phosphohydrolase [Geobacter sp. SVR]